MDNMERTSVHITATLPLVREKSIEPEQEFLQRIALECRRAERSKQRFVLALVEGFKNLPEKKPAITASLAATTRETDAWGWYEANSTLGIIFTELGGAEAENARDTIVGKIQAALLPTAEVSEDFAVLAYILPHDLNKGGGLEESPKRIYEPIEPFSSPDYKLKLAIKRAVDLVGSALLLVALAPVMAIIALAVKWSSPGPVLFRQTRVGQKGKHFTFFKFRSMTVANDHTFHETYVKQFIRGTAIKNTNEKGEGVFKLTQDPRVTPVGKFLRKTSFDELPQFWNVLRGEMSLVGPRPPITYEVECYDLWHQRRVLESKPGITGLWQVSGRSRLGFDDMVRLDLQYARTWSPWLDMKILLKTPLAVFGGDGAH